MTDEIKEKIRATQIRKGAKPCPLAYEKLKGCKKPPAHNRTKILCLNNNVVYLSQREAANLLGLQQANIHKVLNGQRKHTKGYVFVYVNKKEVVAS